jgi:hypothetical protein
MQGLDLPDADDRHVLAAGIRANAQALVTFNLKDFPEHVLARYDMETKHPDEFVLDSIAIAPGAVVKCITDQAAALRNPPMLVPSCSIRFGGRGSCSQSPACETCSAQPPPETFACEPRSKSFRGSGTTATSFVTMVFHMATTSSS